LDLFDNDDLGWDKVLEKSYVVSVYKDVILCLACGSAHLRAGLEAIGEERLKITHQHCCKSLSNR